MFVGAGRKGTFAANENKVGFEPRCAQWAAANGWFRVPLGCFCVSPRCLSPHPGDLIEIEGNAFLIQGEPVRNRERIIWTADLCPA
ncbi:hypothetical protein FP2506_17274 [Fulvimarina pelagi HTCC2506]|uniref:Uncharacterized protein n=1 Tax=Fulvimarina pelagi HTCC2506 TaxID=314231 RepID=Q0FY93_9HYPH|nr:hypothetical protein FP2506_17274 [Fulvimarina pelagi HTCC2506]